MKHLLIDNAAAAEGYRHGIYWCARNYEEEDSNRLTLFVHELAAQIQTNFQITPIDGFDEVMEDLWHHVSTARAGLSSTAGPRGYGKITIASL